MTKNNYKINNVDHTTFGGNITLFDFEGYNSLTMIADKIVSDWRFDANCKRNIEAKYNYNKECDA